jgi:hypothetical protein
VLVGKERFSENQAWSEMPQHWPSCLAARAVIEVVGQGQLEARLVDGGPPVGLAHLRIVATAHTASITSDYFAAASPRLGDALAAYLNHQPPAGLLSTLTTPSSPSNYPPSAHSPSQR